jgi:hypothetical protein
MRRAIISKSYPVNNVTGTSYSSTIPLQYAETISVQASVDVNTPTAKTFLAAAIDIATEYITIASHGLPVGLKGQVSNPGTLPTGITAVTDYFVIVIDANTIQLASSLANALAGTSIDITNIGAGTNTFTPTAIAGGTWTLQQTNDGTNWADVASATNVTADASFYVEKIDPTSISMRIKCVVTAGSYSSENHVVTKGEEV